VVVVSTSGFDGDEAATWLRLAAVVELLPGVLDSRLRREADLTHFEYVTLAMLSEAPERTLRMSALAAATNATLPRLSHVVSRMEKRGLVQRTACPSDGRASNVRLTDDGQERLIDAAPGHVATVRHLVLDALSREQLAQLSTIADAILGRVDPDGAMTAFCRRPVEAGTAAGSARGR
jgi:DNA-binding MarR family transcriptional regulator